MPLAKAFPRRLIHTREIRCQGFLRDDGLWDIEGWLVDTKGYSFPNEERGGIAAGEPVHDMKIRITIDADMVIHAAEAVTDSGPFGICGNVTGAFVDLKGLKIGPGWRKAVLERMGGIRGCTHLTDLLLGPLPVTAFQALHLARQNKPATGDRPATLDTCHALASDSPVTKRRWPQFYTGT